jgi:hypothetical protein
MKVTEWYPANVFPAREGVYERDYGSELAYCYWDGSAFYSGWHTPNLAYAKAFEWGEGLRGLSWRGLAEKP